MAKGAHDATAILENLNITLRNTLEALDREEIKAELAQKLHNDQQLPEKGLETLAANTIDLVARLEKLLEPAHLVLADHFLGYTSTKCLVTAVEMRIPDLLRDQGPLTLEELASKLGCDPLRLGQILQTLYSVSIFAYDAAERTYRNSPASVLLCSDHWTQWHNWVSLYGNEFYDIARGIPAAIANSGKKGARFAAQVNFDTDLDMFAYFASQGWVPKLHRTLGGGATAMAPGILQDYPWAEVGDKTVMDIGGGGGGLIVTLLKAHEKMHGGVYDTANVISHISDAFLAGGEHGDLAERVPQGNLVAGDFLRWVPPSEVYTIKWVLHDWTDDDAIVILRNARKAIIPGEKSRLVVLESILSDTRMGRLSRYGNINMMMTANGRERTEEQWRELIKASGWRIDNIYPLRNAWIQAIDLRPC
ncbi:hypothetical protein PG995_013246 [Apiospora arundinis]